MIMFHIWSGKLMPEQYRQNIRHNHQFLSANDRHILIGTEIIDCCETVNYNDYIIHIRQDSEWNRLLHDINKGPFNEVYTPEVAESDMVRFYFAMEEGSVSYADCDFRWNALMPCDKGRICFPKNNVGFDIFAFIVNDGENLIREIMADTAKFRYQGNGQFGTSINSDKYKDKIDVILNSLYTHDK